ncbi:hypothetical protein [Paenibacillus sp. PL2-23]
MSEHFKTNGDSAEQKRQAAQNESKANRAGGAAVDKKLNGPNRPST